MFFTNIPTQNPATMFKVNKKYYICNNIENKQKMWWQCNRPKKFDQISQLVQSFRSAVLFSSTMAVDTFFCIAGLLTSIYQLSYLKKWVMKQWSVFLLVCDFNELRIIYFRNGKLNALQMYLHRLLHHLPLLIAAILLSMSLLRFLGSGPLWTLAIDLLSGACRSYYWSTFAFVQNYVNPNNLVSFFYSMRILANFAF